jgi:hypothetical protein
MRRTPNKNNTIIARNLFVFNIIFPLLRPDQRFKEKSFINKKGGMQTAPIIKNNKNNMNLYKKPDV